MTTPSAIDLVGGLRFDRVSKRLRGRDVLRDVTCTVAPGAVLVVTGRNGTGKTTFLRIAAGLSRPNAGVVDGRPRRVAFVPDRFTPPGRLTAREYLHHLGRLRGHPADDLSIDSMAERLGLSPGPDVPLGTLSRGNRQKVCLAQAFLADAGLLVLDEPRTALDEPAEDALRALVAESIATGATVLASEPNSAGALTGRIVALEDGRLQERPAGDECMVVVLHRATAPDSADVPSGATVIDQAADGTLTLQVDADAVNTVVLTTLGAGWSLVEVRRDRRGEP